MKIGDKVKRIGGNFESTSYLFTYKVLDVIDLPSGMHLILHEFGDVYGLYSADSFEVVNESGFSIGDKVKRVSGEDYLGVSLGSTYKVIDVLESSIIGLRLEGLHGIYNGDTFEKVSELPEESYTTVADMPCDVEFLIVGSSDIFKKNDRGYGGFTRRSINGKHEKINISSPDFKNKQAVVLPKKNLKNLWDEYVVNGVFRSQLKKDMVNYSNNDNTTNKSRVKAAKAYLAWAEAGYPS